ncbi:glycosyltransferase family A protein [Moorena sp. SIO3I6]|uniref:glycosyltransferase family 2 protein n=1 Tax=Moorena sp. SIO3I6 TaxID=2607831 RepID=UPI0013F9BBF2|nr:glycosyltransferase family A protein [Moorena sp. SIO3I6]NEP23553.1 glycosyltransferase family 2 protein [Moorena sp. SIO3I6]
MPETSIIIRCYNEEEHIGRLLSGIMQQTIQDVEIIVVDSGSTDATPSIASRYRVKLLSIKPEEFSFGRALNLGCQAATGQFIVIASAHVYPIYQDWIEKLLAPFKDPKIALTYGKQRGNETSKYSEHQIFATWFPDQSVHVRNQDYPFCNNANAAIRRSLWEDVPYDETLTGLEDLDWAKRIMPLGYRIAYVPAAEIIHVHEETPKRIYNRYQREAIALKQIYPQEHFHFWDFLRLFTTNVVSDYYHAFHDGVFKPNLLSIPIFRLMQFWGTYQGFAQRGLVSNRLRQTFYYPRSLSPYQNTFSYDNRRLIDYGSSAKSSEQVY